MRVGSPLFGLFGFTDSANECGSWLSEPGRQNRPMNLRPQFTVALSLLLLPGCATPAAGPLFPEVSTLPRQEALPNPLTMLDGGRVTTRAQWFNQRRPELKLLFQHYTPNSNSSTTRRTGCPSIRTVFWPFAPRARCCSRRRTATNGRTRLASSRCSRRRTPFIGSWGWKEWRLKRCQGRAN
jgi:hypothetical protein